MELDNIGNIRYAFKESLNSVAYCALTIRCGTRDEESNLNGLAHFTEHMLFKGTAKRKSASINKVLESVGGELNAYTTKEEIVLHATVLKEELPKAIDLLAELAFTSTFAQQEIIKERDVIFDEIDSYKDLLADAIYDEFESLLFKGHPLSMPILGDKKSLKRIDTAIFKDFVKRFFIPNNLVFTVVANSSAERVERLIKRSMAKYYSSNIAIKRVEESNNIQEPKELKLDSLLEGTLFNKSVNKKSHQGHCILGTTAYSCMNKKRIPLILLVNILGGVASSSRLNTVLRERYGLVYNVDASYTSFADSGIVSIYFGCDKQDIDKCIKLIKREIDKLVETELSCRALSAAKKQLIGQLAITQDNGEAQALSMGKSIAVYNSVSSFNKMVKQIEGVTAKEIKEVAAEIFNWDRISVLKYI